MIFFIIVMVVLLLLFLFVCLSLSTVLKYIYNCTSGTVTVQLHNCSAVIGQMKHFQVLIGCPKQWCDDANFP